ncbi:MAG: APC family permease [Planctomycetota bacterium]|jgi:amino acid transporter
MPREGDNNAGSGKLGTFGGVFVPNLLTILGVIMFLRTGWVVGNAGLVGALLILLIAKSITVLTSLSLAAISTNTKVGAGGAYFLISRSLGLEVGGSIGVPLFFAQAVSVAFYLVGFSESLHLLMPGLSGRLVSSVALGVFGIVAWFGAGIVVRAQYVILVLLGLSIASIFTGFGPVSSVAGNASSAYLPDETFWTVFAIFFPAVTGIMAGVSMSGDLREPSRGIPRGTILAVLVAFVIYAAQMVWLAARSERGPLLENNLVLLEVASVPALIYVGLWAATLSSALASLAAAPRTLQALGHDRVVPTFLGRSIGAGREPRVALLVTVVIAEACVLIGDLNLIAPIISMFFLATYGTLNLVAGVERLVSNPSYRPTFRTHWLPSLLGAAACLGVMFLIHVPATLLSVVVIAMVYTLLTRRRLEAAWGDMRSGIWFAVTRFGLLRYMSSRQHIRNWRPVVLVLADKPKARVALVDFAHGFEARRGFLFLAQVIVGDWSTLLPRQRRLEDSLRTFIREQALSAVPKCVVSEDFESGVSTLLQVVGIGEFEPNTVMVGWSDQAVRRPDFARAIRHILELQKNLLVFREAPRSSRSLLRPVMDVWWYARDNGSFMLTLAYLLRGNAEWQDHQIRVLRIIRDEAGVEAARSGMKEIIDEMRVPATVEVIVSTDPPMDVIARTSQSSDVCFVGVSVQAIVEQENPLALYTDLFTGLYGNVFLTKSWHDLQY